MARVRSKDTQPEWTVRRFLYSRGFRYRIHSRVLPGCPDLVLRKYRTVIFVNGCFWHHHDGCKRAALPNSRVRFWKTKIFGNVARDAARIAELKKMGWKALVVWECEAEREGNIAIALKSLLRRLNRSGR